MRASSVVGLRPRIFAAPFSPLTRQLVCSKISRMCCRSMSSSVSALAIPTLLSDGESQSIGSSSGPSLENHGTFDHMFQLANVARPLVSLERRDHPFRNLVDFLAEIGGTLADKILREQWNVPFTLAKRGK